jgi:hypothetical protein
MRAPTRLAMAFAAVASLSTACVGEPSVAPSLKVGEPTSSAATSPRGSAAAPEVPEILMFEAPLLSGGRFDGTSLAGKDVAFWFWAPW